MLPDGTAFNYGDTSYRFGIESVSKVPTAILAMKQSSPEGVLEKIGADATGLPFNSIFAILLENHSPSTPLVNAGAISACSMIEPKGDSDAKWKAITDNITDLCGSAPVLIDELYKSESDTNFNNRAITWLLKNYERVYHDPQLSLHPHTRPDVGLIDRRRYVLTQLLRQFLDLPADIRPGIEPGKQDAPYLHARVTILLDAAHCLVQL